MVDDLVRKIYNTYLKVSRGNLGKPFRYRKDFSNFDKDKLKLLNKLAKFFRSYPHIDVEDYLSAPYKVWQQDSYIPLDFYIKRNSLKVYKDFKKLQVMRDPDTKEQLEFIIDSLKYINKFCKERGISIEDYIDYRDGGVSAYLIHLKEHKVSIYTLYGFPKFKSDFFDVDSELKKVFYGDYYLDIDIFYRKYITSSKAKKLVEKGLRKLRSQI